MTSVEPKADLCPSEEELMAYLGGVTTAERQLAIDAHLATCDACLQALIVAARRTALSRETLLLVPEEVLARAAARVGHAAVAQQRADDSTAKRRGVLGSGLRLPARWAALALAAGVALVVVQSRWFGNVPGGVERQVRAVRINEEVKISARRAEVLAGPHPRAAVVATLTRGDTVRVGGQERDWYQVILPDGREGWILIEALR